MSKLYSISLAIVLLVAPNAFAETEVYHVDRLWTGDGPPFEDAALVVKDGKVAAVGLRSKVKAPEDAKVHKLGTAVIIPGLVAPESQLAAGSRNEEEALAPQLRALDGFDFFGNYDAPLSGGVTSVQISPASSRLAPGQGAVVKLAGDVDRRVLQESESMRIVLSRASRNPPTIFRPPVGAVSVDKPLEPTRAQLARSLAGAVAGMRALLTVASRQGASDNAAEADPVIAAVAAYHSGGRTFRITASTAAEVRAALRIAEEFELNVVLVDPVDLTPLEKSFDRYAKRIRGVVLNAGVRPGRIANLAAPAKDAPKVKLPWQHARSLIDRGVKVAIRAAADDDLREMLFVGGVFQQGGLTAEEVLRCLTLTPAELMGVEKRVGSLAEGKDADFVVLNGSPFATRTQVVATYVSGKKKFDSKVEKKATVIRADKVFLGRGKMVDGGSVIVSGGKIRGVGSEVSAPLDATIRDYPGAVIVPGYLDLATQLGARVTSASLATKLGANIDPADPNIAVARQGGVTTVLLGSTTSSSPTPLVAFKLGGKARVLKDPVAIRFAVKGNLTSAVPGLKRTLTSAKAYADSWTKYDAQLAEYKKKLAEYTAAKAKYDAAVKAAEAKKKAADAKKSGTTAKTDTSAPKPPVKKPESKDEKKEEKKDEKKTDDAKKDAEKKDEKKTDDKKTDATKTTVAGLKAPVKPTEPKKPRSSSSLEPYRPLFAGKIPAFVEARNINELRAATKLFREEFKIRTVIIGADDTMRDPDLLSKNDVGVSLGPTLVRTVDRRTVNTAQILANRQVPFGFQSQAAAGVKTLPLAVQYAVRKGLSAEDALDGLTMAPAKLLSLDESIGSLAPGKDADLVVLSGSPFDLATRVLAVMIDGEWVYEEDSQP